MERRTLLKSVLALPLAVPAKAEETDPGRESGALFSGLAGLDYASGGLRPGRVACIVGPACMGKTLLLLEVAARIVRRYGRNVLFYSAQKPCAYLAKKAALRGDAKVVFAGEPLDDPRACAETPALHMLDSTVADAGFTFALARRLQRDHPFDCALVIWDGLHTGAPAVARENAGVTMGYPAERWPHQALTLGILMQAQRFAEDTGTPILMGITTASLVDCEALVESAPLEREIQIRADRVLTLHRPAIYQETSEVREGGQNLVRVTGTSTEWWDTRCAELRFDPRCLGFETVV